MATLGHYHIATTFILQQGKTYFSSGYNKLL